MIHRRGRADQPLVPSMLARAASWRRGRAAARESHHGIAAAHGASRRRTTTPSCKLDYVGQPYVVAGADRFGSFVGGGVSFVMSDMLGDRTLGAVVQIQGEFDTFGGQLSYINRRSRFNWGAGGRADSVHHRPLPPDARHHRQRAGRARSRSSASIRSTGRPAASSRIRSADRSGSNSPAACIRSASTGASTSRSFHSRRGRI